MPFRGDISFPRSAAASPKHVDAPCFDVSNISASGSLLSKLQSQNTALETLRVALDDEDEAVSGREAFPVGGKN